MKSRMSINILLGLSITIAIAFIIIDQTKIVLAQSYSSNTYTSSNYTGSSYSNSNVIVPSAFGLEGTPCFAGVGIPGHYDSLLNCIPDPPPPQYALQTRSTTATGPCLSFSPLSPTPLGNVNPTSIFVIEDLISSAYCPGIFNLTINSFSISNPDTGIPISLIVKNIISPWSSGYSLNKASNGYQPQNLLGGFFFSFGGASVPICPTCFYITTANATDLATINGLVAKYGKVTINFNSSPIDVSMSPTPLPTPTLISVSPTTILPGSNFTLYGSNFTATGNSIQFSTTTIPDLINITSDGTSLTATIPLDSPEGVYNVRAVNANGTSNYLPLTIKNVKAAPSNLRAVMGSPIGKVNLTWIDNSNSETGFQIERADSINASAFNPVGTTPPGVTSFTDTLENASPTDSYLLYRVRATFSDGGHSDYSNASTLSNCVKISGNGPRKIMFMRDKVWTSTLSDFVSRSTNVVDNGFKAIEPFKKYQNQFSFYIDIAKRNPVSDPLNIFSNDKYKYKSSCDNSYGSFDQYIYFEDSFFGIGPFSYLRSGLVFYNPREETDFDKLVSNIARIKYYVGITLDQTRAAIIIHETGHGFAGLLDEYLYTETGNILDDTFTGNTDKDNTLYNSEIKTNGNCSTNPSMDFRSSIDNLLYGSVSDMGCSYFFDNLLPTSQFKSIYYRPSIDNLMKGHETSSIKFDVISCGYIISAIKGEPVDKAHAQTHWPECKKLDTAQDRIPAVSSTPKISKISLTPGGAATTVLHPGDPIITGSNYTIGGDNVVLMTNTKNKTLNYSMQATSTDGTTLTFIVPLDIVVGTYTLQTGAFNSAWSSSKTVTVSLRPIDTTKPIVTAFTIPTTASSLTIPVSSFTATDAVGVTGYLITESSAVSLATASSWTSYVPTSYTASSAGKRILYAWAKDAAGNVSASRNDSVVITVIAPPPTVDITSPSISGVNVFYSVNQTSAIISWTADEFSDTQVVYGLTSSYGSQTAINSSLTLLHSIQISGLQPNTTYHYQVRSRDGSGNLGVSGDLTMVTAPLPPPAPSVPFPTLTVTSPAQSSMYEIGSGVPVSWTSNQIGGSIKLELVNTDMSVDQPIPLTTIVSSGASGNYTFNLSSDFPQGYYYVRATYTPSNGLSAVSALSGQIMIRPAGSISPASI